jgi:hypothetical protein
MRHKEDQIKNTRLVYDIYVIYIEMWNEFKINIKIYLMLLIFLEYNPAEMIIIYCLILIINIYSIQVYKVKRFTFFL